jgi:hypothetical protein
MAHQLPVAEVCRVLGAPRSTVYARRQSKLPARPGPATAISDHDLLGLIRRVLQASPFAGPAAAAPGRALGPPAGPWPAPAAAP